MADWASRFRGHIIAVTCMHVAFLTKLVQRGPFAPLIPSVGAREVKVVQPLRRQHRYYKRYNQDLYGGESLRDQTALFCRDYLYAVHSRGFKGRYQHLAANSE